MQISGVIPPMVTPTNDDRTGINREALASFTEFLVDGDVDALFPCGSIGEFSSLTHEQRLDIIETVVRYAGDRPVLAGCGGTSVGEVKKLIADANYAGADAAVVVTPYYLNGPDDGLVKFYDRLAEDSPLPIILYDIPSLTGNNLSISVVSELATRENIIGIKDSTGDIIHHQQLIESTPDQFQTLQGMAELAISAMDIGADGFVAGPANVYPDPVARIYEAHRQGNRIEAVQRWRTVSNPIVTATRPIATSVGLKYLLQRRGKDVGGPLPPLSLPTQTDRDRLDKCHNKVEVGVEALHSSAD